MNLTLAVELLRRRDLDVAKLRLGFVVYGGFNRKDWRTVSTNDVQLERDEREFIERLNEHGEIVSSLLTSNREMQQTIEEHPALHWKAIHVRKHRGLPTAEEAE